MTAINTNVLSLLGKYVSFTYVRKNNLHEHHLDYFGQVTSVIINLNDDPQICLFGNDQFYYLSELIRFEIKD